MSSPSHNSPSPSSTISKSNSPLLAISTRRPRTRRKRPNQTYDEVAALLSTAYPSIFSSSKTKTLLKSPPLSDYHYDEASHLLLPFQESGFLFNPSILVKSDHLFEHDKEVNLGGEIHDSEANGFGIFDEEIEQGIDSFMGNIESGFSGRNCHHSYSIGRLVEMITNPSYGSSMGLRSALRENDDANWCRFPTVEFEQISPAAESKSSEQISPLLKLDYAGVLEAWSDKDSPFSDHILSSDAAGVDLHARLGEIDLFGESGMREASVLRYKEKRRNRLFSNSKKIRYQVRKLNADQRPRMKGRFVRRPNVRNLSGLRL